MEIDKSVQKINLNDHVICNNKSVCEADIQFDNEIEKVINEIAKKEGFVSYKVDKKLLSNVGGNYLGILYEVDIKGRTVNGQKELNLFLKKIIPADKMTFISINDAYSKEMYFYGELSKIYSELQNEANVPEKDKLHIVKCYGILKKSLSETVILDNLVKKGYTTCDRLKSICPKFAELAVVDIAKFHALGYVLERKRGKYFESVIKAYGPPFITDEKWVEFVKCVSTNTLDRIDCKFTRNKVEQFIDNKLLKEFDSYLKVDKYSTLCHGDFRANNVMVKSENGEYTRTSVVDYQFIHYGPPLNDFMYFIFGATDQSFRRNHLYRLKDLYYDTMETFLRHFGLEAEAVYPREAFEGDFKRRLDYGLMMALQVLPFVLASESDVPDFGETDMAEMKISEKDDAVFKDRALGVVDDYMNWGYL